MEFIQTQWSTVIIHVTGNLKDVDVTVPKPHYCVNGYKRGEKDISFSVYHS